MEVCLPQEFMVRFLTLTVLPPTDVSSPTHPVSRPSLQIKITFLVHPRTVPQSNAEHKVSLRPLPSLHRGGSSHLRGPFFGLPRGLLVEERSRTWGRVKRILHRYFVIGVGHTPSALRLGPSGSSSSFSSDDGVSLGHGNETQPRHSEPPWSPRRWPRDDWS